MELIKYGGTEILAHIKHDLRQLPEGKPYGNESVDPELSGENYSLIDRGSTAAEVNKYRKDVEKEILNQVYTRMVVDAIAEKEKIKISDKEYRTTLAEYVDSMEYEDDKSLLEDFGEDEVRFWMIQEKVIEFIVDQAQITEIETEQFQEDELE